METRLGRLAREGSGGIEALLLLGVVLGRSGRWDEAAMRLDAVLAAEPNHAEALIWAAAARKSQGRFAEAIVLARRLLDRLPDDFQAQGLLGACLLAEGKAAEAEAAFRAALRLGGEDAAAHANLGMALRLQNRGEEALAAFRTARDLDPSRASNHLQLFKQLQGLSRWDEAVEALRSGLARHPGSAPLIEALASAYGRLGRAEGAEALFRRVCETSPSSATAYASWLQEEGRFEDALPVLQRSLRAQPLQGAPYRLLVESGRTALDGAPLLPSAQALAQISGLADAERMHLAYAIGKLHERQGGFEAAMRSFNEANTIAFRIYPSDRTFDPVWTQRELELIAGRFSRDLFARLAPIGIADARPIFIVGMIRSGTTLLDRIVSAHPDVDPVGEGAFWNVEADALHRRWMEREPDAAEIALLASRYLSAVGKAGTVARFTDKMPLNYRNLGPIHATFPGARIVHIRRNPLDTCLSIYSTFLGGSASFLHRRESIVAFYRAYLGYMAHWRSVLPSDRLLEVDYETLVADPEPSARRIVDFLGLDWNDACLRHEANRSAIGTPSRWQARQPIYRDSVERWRRYEPWLGSFLDLKDADHPPLA